MDRIIPTAVVVFGGLMLMFRAFDIQSGRAEAAVGNNSTRLEAVDGVLQALGQSGSAALPPGLLIAGVAMILAVGYAVVS